MFIIFAGSHPPSTLRDRVSRNHYSHTKRPGTKINQFGEWGDKSSVRRTIKFLNKLQLPALKTTCHWRQVFVWPERKTLSPSATLWGKRSFQSNWREVGLEDPWNARRPPKGIGSVTDHVFYDSTMMSWWGWNRLTLARTLKLKTPFGCFLEFRKLM